MTPRSTTATSAKDPHRKQRLEILYLLFYATHEMQEFHICCRAVSIACRYRTQRHSSFPIISFEQLRRNPDSYQRWTSSVDLLYPRPVSPSFPLPVFSVFLHLSDRVFVYLLGGSLAMADLRNAQDSPSVSGFISPEKPCGLKISILASATSRLPIAKSKLRSTSVGATRNCL